MKTNAGLWISHREAVIVTLSEAGETTRRIESNVVKQHAQEMPPDDIRERVHTEHLSRFYDQVIAHVHAAGSILIIGPGEAKDELKKRFEARKGESRNIDVVPADHLSEPQIAAQVRLHFKRA